MNQLQIHELAIKALNMELQDIRINLLFNSSRPLATVEDIIATAKLLQEKLDQIDQLKSR